MLLCFTSAVNKTQSSLDPNIVIFAADIEVPIFNTYEQL